MKGGGATEANMALNVGVRVDATLPGGIPGLVVETVELLDAISEPFRLTVRFLSEDPELGMAALVGQQALVTLPDQPFLPRVRGLVRRARQLTSEPTGLSAYEIVVVPALWLTTRRSHHFIYQNKTSLDIVAEVLARYGGRIPAPIVKVAQPPARREYVAQYGESDFDFITRLLAEDGLPSFFDASIGAGDWTIVGDTTLLRSSLDTPIDFVPPSQLSTDRTRPHVVGVRGTGRITTTRANLRDFDADNPRLALEGVARADEAELFANEADLEDSDFAVGDFRSVREGDALAGRRLSAQASRRVRATCATTFALAAGTEWKLVGHPAGPVDGRLLVVRAKTVLRARSGAAARAEHSLECADATVPYVPPPRAKPRVAGAQTARVVAATTGSTKEIDVDSMGRVLLEFPWDRRDLGAGTSRRVRVAQAWAGPGYGLVTLPRVGDEVVVAYLDGDPDQPLVVGRVHNAVERTPLDLPAEDTVSVWRSRSSPGGGGFNQVLMDDRAGAERLEARAERDFRMDVGKDALINVVGDTNLRIGGSSGTNIQGGAALGTGGPVEIDAPSVDIHTKSFGVTATHMRLAGEDRIDESATHRIEAGGIYVHGSDGVQLRGGKLHVFFDDIVIQGGKISLVGGEISIDAGGSDVDVKGALIKLNC